MPVTVKFDPSVLSSQAQVIPNATLNNDGVMTKAQVAELEAHAGGSICWTTSKTWAEVYAAYVLAGSCGIIYVETDPTFAPRQMTIGTYDLTRAQFIGIGNGVALGPTIDIAAGATIDTAGAATLSANNVTFVFHGKLAADGDNLSILFTLANLERANDYGGEAFASVANAAVEMLNGSSFIDNFVGATTGIIDFANNANGLIGLTESGSLCPKCLSGTALNTVIVGSDSTMSALSIQQVSGAYIAPFVPFLIQVTDVVTDRGALPIWDPTRVGQIHYNPATDSMSFANATRWVDLGSGTNVTAVKVAADNYTAKYGDLVRCDPSGGAMPITFPTAAFAGQTITVKNVTASANNITISPQGGQTIDGAANQILNAGRASVTFVSNGVTDWMQVV